MRTLIHNVNIISGDGKSILENKCLALEDELIDGIMDVAFPPLQFNADRFINAHGGFAIPGIINHHTHAVTIGPAGAAMAMCPISKSYAVQNLTRHMAQGETTIVNVDGFATMEEIEETRTFTPVLLQTMSSHTPLYLEFAKTSGCRSMIYGKGLREEHYRTTVQDMVKQGALGIGEASSASDIDLFDMVEVIDVVKAKTGVQITIGDARAIRKALFAEAPDEKTVTNKMMKLSITSAIDDIRELKQIIPERLKLGKEANREATAIAGKLGVPFLMHNSPNTKEEVLDLVKDLGGLFIASHCNYLYKPQEACEVARAVKKAGGWVDVHSGDYFEAKQHFQNHATLLALLEEGLVDIISTDFMLGHWDAILRTLEYAVAQNVIELPKAIALATANVTAAIPNIAPKRGQIAEGKIADIVILSPKNISDVRMVIIRGKVVVDEGKIVVPTG